MKNPNIFIWNTTMNILYINFYDICVVACRQSVQYFFQHIKFFYNIPLLVFQWMIWFLPSAHTFHPLDAKESRQYGECNESFCPQLNTLHYNCEHPLQIALRWCYSVVICKIIYGDTVGSWKHPVTIRFLQRIQYMWCLKKW